MQSPFLGPHATTQDGQLTILHIRRDQSIPTVLAAKANPERETGYAEGVVTNTRFGSFPHSTLVGLPWGSQVRASVVDTGSRGRKQASATVAAAAAPVGQNLKRRAEDAEEDDENDDGVRADMGRLGSRGFKQREAIAASSGFIHVLSPTPENWTTSLSHRTQVVYTPDYSYILHRVRARPGSVVIEAGSGSGSFTHAAARAVFNGYLTSEDRVAEKEGLSKSRRSVGKVFSYEFHADRYAKVREEVKAHGLDSIVTVIERDVYHEGFMVKNTGDGQNTTPMANVVFLDLPAPWQALHHLTRQGSAHSLTPLDPQQAVYLCTFSPCIEQAQKTVSALRRHGWIDIDMVEMQQKRIEVRREYVGFGFERVRGVNAIASDVEEAVARLEDQEQRTKEYNASRSRLSQSKRSKSPAKPQKAQKPLFKGGRLVHRDEPELKAHTSYLVFAILPREWTEHDEIRARARWAGSTGQQLTRGPKSQRQLKKEAKEARLQAQEEKASEDAADEQVGDATPRAEILAQTSEMSGRAEAESQQIDTSEEL